MKTKLIISIALICSSTIIWAQKKSTYIISPISVSYRVVSPENKQDTKPQQKLISQESSSKPQQEEQQEKIVHETVIPSDAFEGIKAEDIIEPHKMANDCYIAYLIKNSVYKQSADRKLLMTLCDENHINTLILKYDSKTLKKCGKYHDKRLNIYIR